MKSRKLKNQLKLVVLQAAWVVRKPEIHDALFKSRSYQINELMRGFVSLFQSENTLTQSKVLEALSASRSQLGQDIWALSVLNKAHEDVREDRMTLWGGAWPHGYFVEVGAWDGMEFSNTYMFEKGLGWTGICIEPGQDAFAALSKNRNCAVFNCAAWTDSGQFLDFRETAVGPLSTLEGFGNDWAKEIRSEFKPSKVEARSLKDLLLEAKAPGWVDYLSVDTEGSELQVLEGFPWDTHNVGVATIEHNFTGSRKKLEDFMLDRGFEIANRNISAFDAWFVNKSLIRVRD